MDHTTDEMHKETTAEEPSWSEVIRILGVTKHAHEITDSDITGLGLPTLTHWSVFYASYSQYQGFSVRNDKIRRDKNNVTWKRRWVCSREGYREKKWNELLGRKRAPKPITRIGCKACLTVALEKEEGVWVATQFKAEHNHELASPSELHFLRSHRSVPNCMVSQATSMRLSGIRTISILDYLAMQCGGREHLPFTKKDFYNKLAQNRTDMGAETDSEGALGYLTCLAIRDGHFFCRFNVDESNRLHTMFWSDGTSRNDYKIFGEVLAFDTTYRTNSYNKPLMILVGVNHHFRTCVFGVALLADETAETYTWVLENFLECMDGRPPKTVVTDGDLAMRVAIGHVFPNAVHRLCAWHLETNAGSNVPNGEFKIQFSRLIYKFYAKEEFEEQWNQLIQEQNLEENAWCKNVYEKKESWAETYLRGNFVGGMRTTQRCESMNCYMRRFLDSKQLLRDFVSQIDQGIQHIRYTEMEDDFKTKHTEPVLPINDPLFIYFEEFASACTRAIYDKVAKQIERQNAYTVASAEYVDGVRVYRLSRFRFGEIHHDVTYLPDINEFRCGCKLFETDGIPCRHIFAVMKHASIDHIPESLIRGCWRKNARASHQLHSSLSPVKPDVMQSGRFGTLASDFNTLGMYASKYEDIFLEARKQFASLTTTFKNLCTLREGEALPGVTQFDEAVASNNNVIRDPILAKTKGREKELNKTRQQTDDHHSEPQRKRCRICNQVGHNRATCRQRNTETLATNGNLTHQAQFHNDASSSQYSTLNSRQNNDTTFTSLLQRCHMPFAQGNNMADFVQHHESRILEQGRLHSLCVNDLPQFQPDHISVQNTDNTHCDNSDDGL